jgi:hypothetical protein
MGMISFSLPLKIRGIMGVISSVLLLPYSASIALLITPLAPLTLKRGILS